MLARSVLGAGAVRPPAPASSKGRAGEAGQVEEEGREREEREGGSSETDTEESLTSPRKRSSSGDIEGSAFRTVKPSKLKVSPTSVDKEKRVWRPY